MISDLKILLGAKLKSSSINPQDYQSMVKIKNDLEKPEDNSFITSHNT